MKVVAVSQRVDICVEYDERRDALDQRWMAFLKRCDLVPVIMPNAKDVAEVVLNKMRPDGILLTGGNSLKQYGGDAPERDAVEHYLLSWAISKHLPVLGVCRGMQMIQHYFGAKLEPVANHVAREQLITVRGIPMVKNSYHCLGALEAPGDMSIWAVAKDGVIKAITHDQYPITGIMWHPERQDPYAESDISLFREVFSL